jgi:DNA-binding CsgD family transcriptional regulator
VTLQLDHLAGALFEGMAEPEKMPEALVCLAGWLEQAPESNLPDISVALPPSYCPHGREVPSRALPCRSFSPARECSDTDEAYCAVCALFEGRQLRWHRVLELVLHCRALGDVVDKSISLGLDSHVAAIILQPTGMVLDCDSRTRSYLKSGDVLRLANGQLCCADPKLQPAFNTAVAEVADSGRTKTILLHNKARPEQRYSLSLMLIGQRPVSIGAGSSANESNILCLFAPLDGRRIATVRQLMDLFGLSAAEARLARAICHDSSVEEYAREQGLGCSTVRTQLSAVFHKTGTRRQASLVRLITGIPVIRDYC